MKAAGVVRNAFDSVSESMSLLFQSMSTERNCATMSTTKIVDRIAKLLNLAEGKGTTPAEAATAAAQANRLMLKHNISAAAVEGASLDEETAEAIERGVLWEGGRVVSWRMTLAGGLARLNCCRILIHSASRYHGTKAKLAIIGRPSNAAVVAYLFAYLGKEIDRLAKAADPGWESARSFRNSFRVAAASTVLQRLRADRAEQRREVKQSTALVVVDNHDRDVQAYAKKRTGGSYRGGGGGSSSAGARAGARAGERIAIRSGLSAGSKATKRIGGSK